MSNYLCNTLSLLFYRLLVPGGHYSPESSCIYYISPSLILLHCSRIAFPFPEKEVTLSEAQKKFNRRISWELRV
jgi:hypothetical protein